MTVAPVRGGEHKTPHRASLINYSSACHKVYASLSPLCFSSAATRQERASALKHHGKKKSPAESGCGFAESREVKCSLSVLIFAAYIRHVGARPSLLFKTSDVSHTFLLAVRHAMMNRSACAFACSPGVKGISISCREDRGFIQLLRPRLITSSCHLANILGAAQARHAGDGFSENDAAAEKSNARKLSEKYKL